MHSITKVVFSRHYVVASMKRFCFYSLCSHLNVLTFFSLSGGCPEGLNAFSLVFRYIWMCEVRGKIELCCLMSKDFCILETVCVLLLPLTLTVHEVEFNIPHVYSVAVELIVKDMERFYVTH